MTRSLRVMGEFERIEHIRRVLHERGALIDSHRIPVGIGDDAAVLSGSPPLVVSVDAQQQGVHFQIAWLNMEALAHRAMAAALSDLPAMGADPEAALVSLALPEPFEERDFDALVRGFAEASRHFGVPIVGGNLSRADRIGIHTTVLGRLPSRAPPVARNGARPGDRLLVVGTLGAAAVGLTALRAGRGAEPAFSPFVTAWRRPEPPLAAAGIARRAHAAIDVSDGLLSDLDHLCEASGLGCLLDLSRLPLHPGHEAACAALGLPPHEPALCGGEDYALLLAWPAGEPLPGSARLLGHFEHREHGAPRLCGRAADGSIQALEPLGWRH